MNENNKETQMQEASESETYAVDFRGGLDLSLIHISEPTRRTPISYAVFCLKKKKTTKKKKKKHRQKKKKTQSGAT